MELKNLILDTNSGHEKCERFTRIDKFSTKYTTSYNYQNVIVSASYRCMAFLNFTQSKVRNRKARKRTSNLCELCVKKLKLILQNMKFNRR